MNYYEESENNASASPLELLEKSKAKVEELQQEITILTKKVHLLIAELLEIPEENLPPKDLQRKKELGALLSKSVSELEQLEGKMQQVFAGTN